MSGRAHRCLGGRAGTEVAPGERVPKVAAEACRRGWEPGQGLFARVTSAVPGLPTVHRAWKSPGGTIPDSPAHGVAAGEVHAPGIGQMSQQQLGEVAVCALVPVHAISLPVLSCMPEVEMQVQHVEAVPAGLCRAVVVGLYHFFPQARTSE